MRRAPVGGSVSLEADRHILDNNSTALNVQTFTLRMIADANTDGEGTIGTPDTGAADTNDEAIDTRVETLAARSAEGIYLLEADGLVVDDTGDLAVVRVHFSSATSTVTDGALADLATTHAGPVKLVSTSS